MSSRYSVLWLLHYIDHTFQGSQLRQCSVSTVSGVVLIPRYARTVYDRSRQPTARVPSVARGTIFNGTLSELKHSNYDLIKNWIFNSIEACNPFKDFPVFTSFQNDSVLSLIYLIVLFFKLLDFLT
jgi:hypothetical protein